MAKNEVKIIISANSTGLKTGIDLAKESVGGLADKSESLLTQMKSHWLEISAAVAGSVYTIKKVIDVAEESFARQERRMAFENLAASIGTNAQQIVAEVRRASGEILNIQETIDITGRAMLLGLEPDTITRLMSVAKASTKITGQTISQAFGDVTLGVARQSKMILDNLGIMLDYDKSLKSLAQSLGKTESQLNDAERRQAFLNATLEAGDKIVGRLKGTGESYNDVLKESKAALSDAIDSIKDATLSFDNLHRVYEETAAFLRDIEPLARVSAKSIKFLAKEVYDLGDAFLYWTSLKTWSEIGRGIDDLTALIKRTREINAETERMEKILSGKKIIKKLGLEFEFKFPKEYDNLTFVSKEMLAAFDDLADETLKSVDAKIKAEADAYGQLKTKTADWLRYNINMIEKERDEYINAGVSKVLAEQVFNDKRKELVEQFVKNRSALYGESIKKEEADVNAIRETYSGMYDALGFDAKGYYDFRKGLLEKQREEEITITGDITLAWEAYYARQRELDNERIRHSGSAMEGVRLFFDEESRRPISWASEVEGGLEDLKQSLKSISFTEVLREAESFGDAMSSIFEKMANNVLDSVAKIGTNMLINSLFSMVGGLFTPALGAGTSTIGASYTGGAGSTVSSGGGVNYNGITGTTAYSTSGSAVQGGGSTIIYYITKNDIRTNDVDSFRKLLRQNRGTLNEITVEGKRKNRNFEKQLKG